MKTMKQITLSLILVATIMASCQNSDTIVTETITSDPKAVENVVVEGVVYEEFSLMTFGPNRQALNNVTARLMHDGVELDAVNTNETGRYTFDEQPVPIEGAYLIFEASGFHKNVSKINNLLDPDLNIFNHALVRKTFDGLTGDGITDEGPYISLITGPADRDQISPVVYYVTDADNKLIGARRNFVEAPHFEITTLADQPLFLHYLTECTDQVIEIGSFSEDTDISSLLDGFNYDNKDRYSARTKVFDCQGVEVPVEEYDKFSKINHVTRWSANTSNISTIGAPVCSVTDSPALVSVATQNPRMYGETLFDLSSGIGHVNITICEEDDTYLNYNIGGGPVLVPDLFTYANILPNSAMLLKMKEPIYPGGTDIAFYIDDSTSGANAQGEVLFNNWPQGSTNVNVVGNNLAVNITSNDGLFVEGTFDGEVFDAFEVSLGTLTGEFRARIQ